LLQNDPFSRRIIISAWNPAQLNEQALPSCHILIQFYVTVENGEKYLSCMFTMRSNDFDTANNYNTTCYSLLTYILAKKYNMKPKELIYVAGDTHIYKNHIEQVKEQLTRIPRPFPNVKLSESIKTKDWKDITVDDFELIGYFPDKTIQIKMAV
jgi:thymidylate synthase